MLFVKVVGVQAVARAVVWHLLILILGELPQLSSVVGPRPAALEEL